MPSAEAPEWELFVSVYDRLQQAQHALTVHQLAELLGVNPLTIYRLCSRGVLPHFRIASAIRFCPKTTAAYLRAHQIGGVQ